MIYHTFIHLNNGILPNYLTFINFIPGVPAFFFVSGFLIYASFIKTSNIRIYAKNRFFRLFPGLFFVTCGGLFVLLFSEWDNLTINDIPTYITWFLAQISIGQVYNPSLFNNVGIGVINGALWTITVEILFYMFVPIIFLIERKFKYFIYLLFCLSFFLYSFGGSYFENYYFFGKNLFRYLEFTPLVWGWMFCLGIICYKNIELINKYIKYFYLAIIPMIALINLSIPESVFFTPFTNRLGLFYFLPLILLILYLSFATPVIKLNFDLSYGVYIWHLVVINFLLELNINSIFIACLLVILISLFSWYLIEKPFLNKKQISIRR